MRGFVVLVACGLLAACGGGGGGTEPSASPTPPPSPATTTRPTKDITYTSGSAEVTLTGGEQVTFSAPLDTSEEATFSRDDGFDVWWRDGDQALNLSGDVEKGEADVFVRVETATGAYVDPFHTLCEVTVTTNDDTTLAGRFTCDELLMWSGEGSEGEEKTVSASGTFSATTSSQASPPS